jgi:DNA (cytosine-5)-methyltransferase 1
VTSLAEDFITLDQFKVDTSRHEKRNGSFLKTSSATEVLERSNFGDFPVSAPDVWRRSARRFHGYAVMQLSGEAQKTASYIGESYCLPDAPLCATCPISKFCDFARNMTNTENATPFVDLFCGGGGLSLGMERAGFRPIFAVDTDAAACDTYLFNRPELAESDVFRGGISEALERSMIPQSAVVVGGPPCQGFSNANRQRLSDDPRNILYREYIRALKVSDAQIALMENVVGIAKNLDKMVEDFREIGFDIFPFTLNAKNFGFPQNRNRVFILCVRSIGNRASLSVRDVFYRRLNLSLKATKHQQFTLSDAIRDLPVVAAKSVRNASSLENEEFGFTVAASTTNQRNDYVNLINGEIAFPFVLNHRSKYNNPRDIEIFSRLKPGEKSDADSIKDIMPYANRQHIFKDKFFRLRNDFPAKTITAHMYYDCHMYIHPEQARGLTPREAARVQGFPDDYLFLGYPNEWYRQIGNAVSPLVGFEVAQALMESAEYMGVA